MGTFRNNTKASILSKEISHFHNRGEAIAGKIQTVLNYIRSETDITHLKNLNEETIKEITNEISERVHNGEIQANSGATYISALNQVIDYTNYFFNKEIEQIHYSDYFSKSIDYADKSVSPETHQSFQDFLSEKYQETQDTRFQALQYAIELERSFGLRFRESAGLNQNTISRALESGRIELSRQDWTKNARERSIEVRTEEQKQLLQEVKNFLENTGKINLAGADNWKSYQEIASFRAFADYQRQEFSSSTGEQYNFHGERHFWAQNMYSQFWEEKTGIRLEAPIKYYSEQLQQAGWNGENKFYEAVKELEIKPFWEYVQDQFKDQADLNIDKMFEIDKEIRQEISEQLGHSRLDITNTYLGHA